MVEVLISMLIAAGALMGGPGPVTLSSAAMGAAFGWRRGLPYVLGMSSGTVGVLVLVATGVTGMLIAIPGIRPVLIIAAAAYILYLAWRIATAPPPEAKDAGVAAPPFVAGVALALVNPKAYAAIGAVFSGSVLVEGSATSDAMLKFAILAPLPVLINVAWLRMGGALAGVMRSPLWGRRLNLTFAALLVLSVAVLLL